jgi:hypothetical protein
MAVIFPFQGSKFPPLWKTYSRLKKGRFCLFFIHFHVPPRNKIGPLSKSVLSHYSIFHLDDKSLSLIRPISATPLSGLATTFHVVSFRNQACFLTCTLRPRWRCVPPKCWNSPTKLDGVPTKKTTILTFKWLIIISINKR